MGERATTLLMKYEMTDLSVWPEGHLEARFETGDRYKISPSLTCEDRRQSGVVDAASFGDRSQRRVADRIAKVACNILRVTGLDRDSAPLGPRSRHGRVWGTVDTSAIRHHINLPTFVSHGQDTILGGASTHHAGKCPSVARSGRHV